MDILNWLFTQDQNLIRPAINNKNTDLIALAADVSFAKREDKWQTYAMTASNFAPALYDTGIVTQTVSNNTTAILNNHTGVITLFGSIAAGGNATFTITNNHVTTASKIFCQIQHTGGATVTPTIAISLIAAGSFQVIILNSGAGIMTVPRIHFTVID